MLVIAVTILPATPCLSQSASQNDLLELGRRVFFDQSLSMGGNQSCATCHAREAGFSGPNERFNRIGAYEGSVHGLFGKRKPQTAAYVGSAPVLHREEKDGELTFIGGSFWDGRATGRRLTDPVAEQAQGPFLDANEQAFPDSACVLQKVCVGSYSELFKRLSPGSCISALTSLVCRQGRPVKFDPAARKQVASGYDVIARTLDAYEESEEVSRFTSKFDAWKAGKAELTPQELDGLALFNGKGKCSNCHPAEPLPRATKAVFTDFTYDNLGVPRNPLNPWYAQHANPAGRNWVDLGLGGFLQGDEEWRQYAKDNMGRFKVPTLRNVDERPRPNFVKSYMHNGYFTSLEAVVDFYNSRDVKPPCPNAFTAEAEALRRGCWPAPEYAATVNHKELGNLGLTAEQEKALVAFMRTLTDGYTTPQH
jgi:cytochrome c peroxidase